MTENEVYEIGFDRGVEFTRWSDSGATLEDILECESLSRQISPFEDLWDQFETGIYDGINSILGN